MTEIPSTMPDTTQTGGTMPTTYTYKVQKHDETGWWQLVENDVVIGAWEKKGDAIASYRAHVAFVATGHKS